MSQRRFVLFLLILSAGVAAGQLAPGYIDPQPVLRAASEAIGVDKLQVRDDRGHRLRGHGGPATRGRLEYRLAARRTAGKLYAHDELGSAAR